MGWPWQQRRPFGPCTWGALPFLRHRRRWADTLQPTTDNMVPCPRIHAVPNSLDSAGTKMWRRYLAICKKVFTRNGSSRYAATLMTSSCLVFSSHEGLKIKIMSLRCTTCCFNMHIHWEIITVVKLINLSITSHGFSFCVCCGHLKYTLLANFKCTVQLSGVSFFF